MREERCLCLPLDYKACQSCPETAECIVMLLGALWNPAAALESWGLQIPVSQTCSAPRKNEQTFGYGTVQQSALMVCSGRCFMQNVPIRELSPGSVTLLYFLGPVFLHLVSILCKIVVLPPLSFIIWHAHWRKNVHSLLYHCAYN